MYIFDEDARNIIKGNAKKENKIRGYENPGFFITLVILPRVFIRLLSIAFCADSLIIMQPIKPIIPSPASTMKIPRHEMNLRIRDPIEGAMIGATENNILTKEDSKAKMTRENMINTNYQKEEINVTSRQDWKSEKIH